MKYLFKGECYRTLRRLSFLILTIALLICAYEDLLYLFSDLQGILGQQYREYYEDLYSFSDPELMKEKCRALWKTIYFETYDHFGVGLLTCAIFSLMISMDLKRGKMGELIGYGYSRSQIFFVKTVIYIAASALIPFVAASVNFWAHPDIYSGYLYADDIAFLVRVPLVTLVERICIAAFFVPFLFLVGKPLWGAAASTFYALAMAIVFRVGNVGLVLAGSRISPPGASLMDYLVQGPTFRIDTFTELPPVWGVFYLSGFLLIAVISVAAAYVIFQKKELK